MQSDTPASPDRRRFLKQTGLLAAAAVLPDLPSASIYAADIPSGGPAIHILFDPNDPIASAPPARWAMTLLQQALADRSIRALVNPQPDNLVAPELVVRVAGAKSGAPLPAESFRLTPDDSAPVKTLAAAAPDARGLVYALAEIADRVNHAPDPRAALRLPAEISEKPANRIRSVMRLFISDVEDKAWFHDRAFWDRYLTMLATHRFNRFNLAVGIGYDGPSGMRDSYLYFAYPFLLDVPGYKVRAVPLPDAERDKNLASLKYISEQAVARGLQFQLGIWTHAYTWTNSPNVNYNIEGLTPELQAPYCRDAIKLLLASCPAISGVTLRVHGESGVPEGNYDFWKTLFGGIASVGRKIEIDMHGKGMDQRMIDTALGSGMPVAISPKFWAEHMGLPYHPASIRALELPKTAVGRGAFALSSGSRSFLRYGYGDLLVKDRKYAVLHRVWPGTQRLLLWGDPAYAAGYGRIFSQLESDGVEYFDPLAFKGRKGSGLPGEAGRGAYADASLRPAGGDFEKYLYTYRLLGRLAYNPDADPECYQRQLRHEFGPAAAPAVEAALAQSSRILPLITSAHDPSAANNNYWPEIYQNMSILDGSRPGPYTDTPAPKNFIHVSSLDPQIFATVNEFADSLLHGAPIGKVTPAEVAAQLQAWADASADALAESGRTVNDKSAAAYRRLSIDAAICAGLGRFFAHKFRSAVLFALFDRTSQEPLRAEALKAYRLARDAWAALAARADGVYVNDIAFGYDAQLRGDWSARLPAIDADIAAMEKRPAAASDAAPQIDIKGILAPQPRPSIPVAHKTPGKFAPGQPIPLEIGLPAGAGEKLVRLWYRRMNQAETFRSAEMKAANGAYQAAIPADYTQSPFALQYYFELTTADTALLYPGFKPDFLGQPYFILEQA